MTTAYAILLADLTLALNGHIRRETEDAPPELRANADTLAALECADVRERAWTAESDREGATLYHEWIGVYGR